MGYLSILNTYKEPIVFQFKRLYALEKIHGTSAHVKWSAAKTAADKPTISYLSGGASHHTFSGTKEIADAMTK